jgi:hypothetical protein
MTDKVKQAVIEEIVTLKSLLTDWEIASLDADDIILDEAKRKCSYRNIIYIVDMSIYDRIEKRCNKCGKQCFRLEYCRPGYREYFLRNECATSVVNNSGYNKEMISIEKGTFSIDYLYNEDYETYLTIAEYTMMVHSEIIRPIINFLKGETSQLIF